jgi:hypothetical protein
MTSLRHIFQSKGFLGSIDLRTGGRRFISIQRELPCKSSLLVDLRTQVPPLASYFGEVEVVIPVVRANVSYVRGFGVGKNIMKNPKRLPIDNAAFWRGLTEFLRDKPVKRRDAISKLEPRPILSL